MLTPEEFVRIVEDVYRFHTKTAPGIAIGVAMVDMARDELGPVKGKMNAIAETQACLSDVLQMMTGCTTGNRYLTVFKDLGRFALTLFDRDDGRGVRVSVALERIDPDKTPELARFFHRQRDPEVQKGGPAREASGKLIVEEFLRVGRALFRVQRVQMQTFGKPPMLPAVICPKCGESYLQNGADHQTCDFCSGKTSYYSEISG